MKVKRLMELLKRCDPDARIEVADEHRGHNDVEPTVTSCAQVGDIVVIAYACISEDET